MRKTSYNKYHESNNQSSAKGVVLARIRNIIRPQISEEQYGFVKGKGTRNAIIVLRNLAEKTLEVNQDLYLCFADYENDFDKVKHEDLMKMLERLEIDGKDLRIIKNPYWNQKVPVKIDDDEPKWQCIEIGVLPWLCDVTRFVQPI